jgi:hypothetical protein
LLFATGLVSAFCIRHFIIHRPVGGIVFLTSTPLEDSFGGVSIIGAEVACHVV